MCECYKSGCLKTNIVCVCVCVYDTQNFGFINLFVLILVVCFLDLCPVNKHYQRHHHVVFMDFKKVLCWTCASYLSNPYPLP